MNFRTIPSVIFRSITLKILGLLPLLLFSGYHSSAQQDVVNSVNVNLTIVPPYSPYYSDYSGANASKVFVVLQNMSRQPVQLKLHGKLTGDNGLMITTKPNYMPSQPIILNGGEVKQLNGISLKDIFDLDNLDISGGDKNKLMLSSRLPEGNYSLCLQALDYNSGRPISGTAVSMGCSNISILYPDAPVLINPMPATETPVTNPQTLVFTWANPGTVPIGTQYKLEIAEMPDATKNPNQVLDATSFPFFSQMVSTTSFLYSATAPALQIGKHYAWRVTATDLTGKVEFKNKGVSGASTFIYGTSTITSNLPITAGALFVVSPTCQNNPSPVEVLMGPNNDLSFSWLWKEQMDRMQVSGQLDENTLSNYTQINTPNGPVIIARYELLFKRISNNLHSSSEKTQLSYSFNAPKGNLKFTDIQARAQGFFTGEVYTLKITAYDKKGTIIDETTSCPWLIKEETAIAQTQLNVTGKLAYTFDKTTYYGANNTSITLQLVDQAKPALQTYQVNGKPVSVVNLDPAKTSVSVSTDAEGNFKAQIPISANDKGNKYILMRINSAYYAMLENNIPVKIPEINRSTANGKTTIQQDTLKLGEVRTGVYNYNLAVTLKKGFPDKISINDFNAVNGAAGYVPVNYNNLSIDKSSIDTLSRLPAGIPVILFRKAKSAYIPYYEAGKKITATAQNANYIPVAEAKTQVSTNGKTIVQFKQLICNFEMGDEYYLQAMLPDTGANRRDELTAPIQQQRFMPSSDQLQTAASNTLNQAINYNIISKKPPMAKVKGKVMYQWPSQPGVLRPYANKPFEISMRVKTNLDKSVNANCQNYPVELQQVFKDARGGGSTSVPLAPGPDNLVVGRGRTDAKGNFEVSILNFMQMGTIEGLVLKQTGPATGPTCAEIAAMQKQAEEKARQIASQPVTVAAPIVVSPVQSITQSINLFSSTVQIGTSASATSPVGGTILKGPSAFEPLEGTMEARIDIPGFVDRYFSLDGLPVVASISGGSPANKPDRFVVQPFETVDLGTIVTNVDEIQDYRINFYVNNSKSNEALTGAKVVVFRGKAPSVTPPDGEGSISHPKKKLLSPDFGGTADYKGTNGVALKFDDPVEWVIDTAFSITKDGGNKGYINLGKKRLLNNESLYALQVTPGAENGGGSFQPVLVSLPINYHSGWNEVVSRNDYLGTVVVAQGAQSYDSRGVYLDLSSSRIAGRVIDASSSKGIKNATICLNNLKTNAYRFITTIDTSGYFEIKSDQFSNFLWKNEEKISITVYADGYTTPAAISPQVTEKGNKYYYTLLMKPAKSLVLKTVDAVSNQVVTAFATRGDGTIFDQVTTASGLFMMAVPAVGVQKVTIYPKDPAYFEETVSYNPTEFDGTKTIKMLKRHHRMRFVMVDNNGNKIQALNTKFKVIINNDPTKVGVYESNGDISFDFENVSINNYTIQVIDIAGRGYIPKVFNLKNEESKLPIVYNVKMLQGFSVSGLVTLAQGLNSKPVQNARVYVDYNRQAEVDYNNNTADATAYSLLESRTDKNGRYVISGIPYNVENGNLKATLQAILDTTFNVNGDKKTINIAPLAQNVADFKLTGLDIPKISGIWGYPLSIEKIEELKVSGITKYKITGLVDLSTNQSKLVPLDPKTKVRITDVILVKSTVKVEYVPELDAIPLDALATLKMKYLNRYNVILKNPKNITGRPLPLTLEKMSTGGQNGGAVNAMVSIVDNSFDFPSSYLSFQDAQRKVPVSFYLFNKNERSSTGLPTVRAIYNTDYNYDIYNLSDSTGKALKFSFIGFPATADPSGSFIATTGKINLDVNVKAKIPNSKQGTLDIRIKNLVLDGNSIEKSKGTEPIQIDLQTWKLQVKDWEIDPKQGGIVSANTLVKTGIVDVKARTFNLRSDLFVLKDFDVENISLGGGLVQLTGIDAKNTSLVFDEACGSDHAAHWRFSAVGSGNKPVASIPLPAIANKVAATILDVNYFQLISYNNENIVSLANNQNGLKLYNNKKFTFFPMSFTSDNNSFALTGQTKIDVPRIGNMALNLVYTKNGSVWDMEPGNFKLGFEGKGYVQFNRDETAKIEQQGHITKMKGLVQEPGKINPMPCTFSFGEPVSGSGMVDKGTVTLLSGYKLRLDGSSSSPGAPAGDNDLSLSISSDATNGMRVDGTNDWSTLKFSGPLNDPKSAAMVKEKPIYNFEVLGDIQVSGNQVKMDQVSTPLGNVEMVYDFDAKEMRGSLHMSEVNFGGYLFSGDVQVTNGSRGMLILGAGSLNTGTLFFNGFGTFNIGLLFGNSSLTNSNISTVTQYSKAKENICWLQQNQSNFKGFFLTGGYDLINERYGFDIGIASVYLNAMLGVEVTLGGNFATSPSPNLMALIGAHGEINAGLDAITGTSISGGLSAHLTASATYSTGGFSVSGNAGVKVKYMVSQWIPLVGQKSFGGSMDAGIYITPKTLKFSLGQNNTNVACVTNKDL
ncbi:MAG: hypothetical protein P0Y49_09725 [Candidatus Pedobacter colombiensis]|uniref:TANFOR domain-containing protein n=1 Tax=Candidatus Pedobacter colombiensis TaxID=3121371 RepID=A0AAJ5WD55_9SPHI|nr:hypothetical protein [Pedobacter sp.]WEK21416.1 MAG: hypothetical protein P0Y49_09725 [Pedobacter sp.]